ncbi:MAG TPA: hypothetical protein ENN23_05180 [Deltaproteobacteria bacterium]|nr:hypothetical protein [Deltaproteobacteria bacterium]
MRLTIEPKKEIYVLVNGKNIIKSRFHQTLPNDFFSIEQTKPHLEENHVNEIVLVSYSTNGENKKGRFGFEARIKAITSDRLVILHKLNDPAACELRSWPRIRHNLLPNIHASCQKKESQVVDVSCNGAHMILYESDTSSKIGAAVKLNFVFDDGEVNIEGQILRKWKDSFHRTHIAISFSEDNDISRFIY